MLLGKKAVEAGTETAAEKITEAVVKKVEWPAELARELQKTRGVERQELRFKSYGLLWKELRPLALYSSEGTHSPDRTPCAPAAGLGHSWVLESP